MFINKTDILYSISDFRIEKRHIVECWTHKFLFNFSGQYLNLDKFYTKRKLSWYICLLFVHLNILDTIDRGFNVNQVLVRCLVAI